MAVLIKSAGSFHRGNPVAYPMPEIDDHAWARLPQNSGIEQLLNAAKSAYGAPDDAIAAAGAGSQAFIQAVPTLFKPQSVAIVGFTYQEHGLCWQQAGHDVLVADGFEKCRGLGAYYCHCQSE